MSTTPELKNIPCFSEEYLKRLKSDSKPFWDYVTAATKDFEERKAAAGIQGYQVEDLEEME